MSRTSIFLFALVSALWIFGGRWYYLCKIKKNCCDNQITNTASAIAAASTLNLMDGDQTVMENFNQFSYKEGAAEPVMSDNNKLFLDSLATWFKNNPDKNLTITGFFTKTEKVPEMGFYENMGLARADAIRAMLADRGVSEERISLDAEMSADNSLATPLLFDSYKPIQKTDTATNVPTVTSEPIVAIDPKPKSYNNNSVAKPKSAIANTPMPKATDKKTAAAKTTPAVGPDAPEKPERLTKQFFNFLNMNFSDGNFEPNSVVFKPSRQFLNYADSVKVYMGHNVKKKIIIVGHTDSRGEEGPNWKLGQRRANEVMAYFKKIGIKSEIEVISKGEKEPIANNINEAGRKKNRRINVIIK